MDELDNLKSFKNQNSNIESVSSHNFQNFSKDHFSKLKIVSKLSSDINSKSTKIEASKNIKDYFEDASKYFETSKIIVGKTPRGPQYDKNNQIIPRTVVGINFLEKKHIEPEKNRVLSPKLTKNLFKMDNLQLTSNFSQLDKNKVSEIFHTAKERIKSGKLEDNKLYEYKGGPKIFLEKNEFDKQEKLLEKNVNRETTTAKLSRAISAKTHKDKKDLLMNKIDNYIFKKQILKKIDSKRPIEEKYGDNGWVLTLRREKEIKHIREAYINIGSDHKPIWRRLIEYPEKDIEIIKGKNLKPDKSLQKFLNKEYFKNALAKSDIDLNQLIYKSNFDLKGENIFEKEIQILDGKDKIYKLYQDPAAKGGNIEPMCIKSNYI